MRVLMKTRAAGPDWRGVPGEVTDVPDATAKELIAAGFAEIAPKKMNITGVWGDVPAKVEADAPAEEEEKAPEVKTKKRPQGRKVSGR